MCYNMDRKILFGILQFILYTLLSRNSLILEGYVMKCKQCGKEFVDGEGSQNNPDFCSDDCNYDYHADQLED